MGGSGSIKEAGRAKKERGWDSEDIFKTKEKRGKGKEKQEMCTAA